MKQCVDDLMQEFREARNQSQESHQSNNPSFKKKKVLTKVHPLYKPQKSRNVSSDKYQRFLERYWDLENHIEDFGTQDLMYYFREKARESGIKYVISNMKRDMGIFKRLLKDYTPSEVCLMIEFLFTSNQDYLDKTSLQPTILVSGWCNKIYQDSLLWLEDKYVPGRKSYSSSKTSNREWGDKSDDSVKIGEWG